MNKQTLLDVIASATEPTYDLDDYITNLEPKDKEIARKFLRDIALEGRIVERAVAIRIISVYKLSYLEELSYKLIENVDFVDAEELLVPIMSLCSEIGKKEHFQFMLDVMQYAEKNNKDTLFELSIRCIVCTDYWPLIIDTIAKEVATQDDRTIIDLCAFFIWKQGNKEFHKLLNGLPSAEAGKLRSFHPCIKERFDSTYATLRNNKG